MTKPTRRRPQRPPEFDELFTSNEVCARLGLTRHELRKVMDAQLIVAIQLPGGQWRFSEGAIRAFEKEQMR